MPFAQEDGHLAGDVGRNQHAGVAGFQDAMGGETGQPGFLHADGPVVLGTQLAYESAQSHRLAAGDHANLAVSIPAVQAVFQEFPGTTRGACRRPSDG